jgi:hypothetical protein
LVNKILPVVEQTGVDEQRHAEDRPAVAIGGDRRVEKALLFAF